MVVDPEIWMKFWPGEIPCTKPFKKAFFGSIIHPPTLILCFGLLCGQICFIVSSLVCSEGQCLGLRLGFWDWGLWASPQWCILLNVQSFCVEWLFNGWSIQTSIWHTINSGVVVHWLHNSILAWLIWHTISPGFVVHWFHNLVCAWFQCCLIAWQLLHSTTLLFSRKGRKWHPCFLPVLCWNHFWDFAKCIETGDPSALSKTILHKSVGFLCRMTFQWLSIQKSKWNSGLVKFLLKNLSKKHFLLRSYTPPHWSFALVCCVAKIAS